jgi:hypothetical protein
MKSFLVFCHPKALNNHPIKELREKVALYVHSISWNKQSVFSIVLKLLQTLLFSNMAQKLGFFVGYFKIMTLLKEKVIKKTF